MGLLLSIRVGRYGPFPAGVTAGDRLTCRDILVLGAVFREPTARAAVMPHFGETGRTPRTPPVTLDPYFMISDVAVLVPATDVERLISGSLDAIDRSAKRPWVTMFGRGQGYFGQRVRP